MTINPKNEFYNSRNKNSFMDGSKTIRSILKNNNKEETTEDTKFFKNNHQSNSKSKDKYSKNTNIGSVSINFNFINDTPKAGLVCLSNKESKFSMNAIIQCLSNVKRLKEYLLKNLDNYLTDKNNGKKVSFAIAKIFKNIWENNEFINNGLYDPTPYKKDILEEITQFKNNNYYRQIQIINFLLNSLNEEIKNKNILPSIKKSNEINCNNFDEYYDFYIKEFNKNKTIISDEFCSIIKKNTTCKACNNSYIEILPEYYFNFKGEVKNLNNSIQDYFNKYNNIKFEIKNYFCKKCNAMRKAYFIKQIKEISKTIIISFDKISNTNEGIKLNEEIKVKDLSYHLIAMIMYFKKNGENIFKSICKNSLDNKWYSFNNEKENIGIIQQSFLQTTYNPLIVFLSCDKLEIEKKTDF